MPELPEVETIKRGLGKFILHAKIVKVEVDPNCKKSFLGEESQVEGASVCSLRRRGKALLIELDNGMTMLVHLRMTGQLIWRGSECQLGNMVVNKDFNDNRNVLNTKIKLQDGGLVEQFAAGHPSKNFVAPLPNAQTRVTFVFERGKLFFNDQRKFGFVKVMLTDEVERDNFIATLAKEPWEMTADELYKKCQRHAKSPIKAVLLDQKLIAGLGNIYTDESLFYASVHPSFLAGRLSKEQVALILEGACKVMDASIESGGSTMATYLKPDGTTGDYLERFAQVFHRQGKPCVRCGQLLLKTKVAGRGTHFCPNCQKTSDFVLGESENGS